MSEFYFPDDIWITIKDFMFHNIQRHGKHLLDDVCVKNFNSVVANIPKFMYPYIGPRIIYSSRKHSTRFVKFIYVLSYKNIRKLIIEWFPIPTDNNYRYVNDDYIRFLYNSNLQNTVLKR